MDGLESVSPVLKSLLVGLGGRGRGRGRGEKETGPPRCVGVSGADRKEYNGLKKQENVGLVMMQPCRDQVKQRSDYFDPVQPFSPARALTVIVAKQR